VESTRIAAKICEKIQFPRSAPEFRLNIPLDASLEDACEHQNGFDWPEKKKRGWPLAKGTDGPERKAGVT
jgi:hypothetical protein